MDWHLRLGHLNVRDVMRLSKDGRIDGLGHISGDDVHDFECSSCILGKGRRLRSSPVEERAQQPLAVVHVDLWGPASTASHGGCKYFLTCYDDYTRKIHLSFIKSRSDALPAMQAYISKVETQLNVRVKCVRSDNGGEFNSGTWKQFMLAMGIEHIKVPPDAHAQNGRVERVHLTILNGVRTVLTHSGLGPEF